MLGTSDPTSIQEHMLKLFDNCASLKFTRGNKVVGGMTSSEVRSTVATQSAVLWTWLHQCIRLPCPCNLHGKLLP